jgi:hypothetical protein
MRGSEQNRHSTPVRQLQHKPLIDSRWSALGGTVSWATSPPSGSGHAVVSLALLPLGAWSHEGQAGDGGCLAETQVVGNESRQVIPDRQALARWMATHPADQRRPRRRRRGGGHTARQPWSRRQVTSGRCTSRGQAAARRAGLWSTSKSPRPFASWWPPAPSTSGGPSWRWAISLTSLPTRATPAPTDSVLGAARKPDRL